MAAIKLLLCCIWIFITQLQAQPPRVEVSDWEIQSYHLPSEFGPGVAGATIASDGNIYYFGGLYADIPIRYFEDIPTYGRLTLSDKNNNPEWEILGELSKDDGFIEPHFTNGHNALKLDSYPDSIFLTCEDSANGQIWRYDIYTSKFITVTQMPIPLEDCCPISIGDKIYIFGGDDNSILYNTTQIYDYNTNSWSFGAEIPIDYGVDYHGCEDINDEFVYFFGGESRDNNIDLNTIPNLNGFKYDIIQDKWYILENVFADVPNYAPGVIFVGVSYIPGTPYILITGGNDIDYTSLYNTAIIFNIDFDGLDPEMSAIVNDMHFARGEAVSVVVESYNRRDFSIVSVYTIGGRTTFVPPDYYTDTTEVIDFFISHSPNDRDNWCNRYYCGYDKYDGYYYPYYNYGSSESDD